MRADLVRAAKSLVLPTLAVAVALAFLPGHAALAVRIYALVLCGFVLLLAVAALRRALPATTGLRAGAAKSAHDRRTPPATLARIEQEVILGIAGSFDLHHRLRPRLRELAAELLASRRHVSLDEDPETARQLLGEQSWDLVRPDRPPPEDRLARGLPPAELARVVACLERL